MKSKFQDSDFFHPQEVIVIPTYWSREKGEYRAGDLVFDHPIPIDEEGTLSRCLKSLNKLKGDFILMLIVVPTHPDIQKDLEKKIIIMINRLNLKYQIIPVFQSTIEAIYEKVGGELVKEVLNFNGYSQVRNACMLLPSILNFKSFILLDDDEIVLDEDFLEIAVEGLENIFKGNVIMAKAGIYLQSHGSPFFKGKEKWWRALLDGKKAMNQAFKLTEQNERYVDTPFAFGGNMSISAKVLEKGISFDPYISRGEDIDFLVNVKSENYAFVLDNKLRILHLPPKTLNPDWLKLRQDIHRFLYMRCKLKNGQNLNVKRIITSKDLFPYPGLFLDWTLNARIFFTSIFLGIYYASMLKFKDSKEALSNIILIFRDYKKLVLKYARFRNSFKEFVPKLVERSDLTDIICEKVNRLNKKR